mmetsp:Transcript_34186/g.97121  ORF Transcript_34186/g.97121 Transcript_34186/m.97121 type:complete len:248 (-) Transcript_34186:98-841(-)
MAIACHRPAALLPSCGFQDPLRSARLRKPSEPEEQTEAPAPGVPRCASRSEELDRFLSEQLSALRSPQPRREVRFTPPTRPPAADAPAALRASTCPPNAVRLQASMRLTAEVRSSRSVAGVTWYHISVFDGSRESHYEKRFRQFKAFDALMRRSAVLAKIVPPLPSSGVLGLRHRLDISDFNDKRLDGLQVWLDAVCRNVKVSLVAELFSHVGTKYEKAPYAAAQFPGVPNPRVSDLMLEKDDRVWQ